ncbi:MAG: hypothetical protein K2N60_06400, partial [Oscillospiraceae bacterium]|nr:hypothetical protein [Oscillospiraceae bacterium]
MRIGKTACSVIAAALLAASAALFASCQKIDEEAPEQIYYIEASERFYIPDIEEAAITTAETVSETEEVTETTETTEITAEITETESESETTEETTEESRTETSSETESETTTVTTTEIITETEPVTEIITETLPVTEETVTETQPVQAALYEMSYPAEENFVKPLGRTFMRDGARILSHTCSGVEFAFRGTKADVTLTSNCKTSKARVAFYVNGEYVKDTMLQNAEETFSVFESDEPQNCIISVVKLSEAAYSNVGVKSINVNSEYGIIPTPARNHKIEFIGDSITCGYG